MAARSVLYRPIATKKIGPPFFSPPLGFWGGGFGGGGGKKPPGVRWLADAAAAPALPGLAGLQALPNACWRGGHPSNATAVAFQTGASDQMRWPAGDPAVVELPQPRRRRTGHGAGPRSAKRSTGKRPRSFCERSRPKRWPWWKRNGPERTPFLRWPRAIGTMA